MIGQISALFIVLFTTLFLLLEATVFSKKINYVLGSHKQKLAENGLGYIDPKQNRVITTHGFRSTFRDWSADKTDYPREVCEHVLAHKLPDEVEAAYLRGAYLEKRKSLMADWAVFSMSFRQ